MMSALLFSKESTELHNLNTMYFDLQPPFFSNFLGLRSRSTIVAHILTRNPTVKARSSNQFIVQITKLGTSQS